MKQSTNSKAALYDATDDSYLDYWNHRDYENAAETMAIRRLLDGKVFQNAADIGGGYGRLCVLLREYASDVTLAEPSQQQLDIAKKFLKGHADIHARKMSGDALDFKDGSLDLITVIRVMHHLPRPEREFAEWARVLADDGYMILEVANYTHARNRLKHLAKGKKMPTEPVDIRSEHNRSDSVIDFVNHNPKTIEKQLADAGFRIETKLSVSNLRSPGLKKIVPQSAMLAFEKIAQSALAPLYFGPSVFYLLRKVPRR